MDWPGKWCLAEIVVIRWTSRTRLGQFRPYWRHCGRRTVRVGLYGLHLLIRLRPKPGLVSKRGLV